MSTPHSKKAKDITRRTKMRTRMQRIIGIAIMTVGIIIGVYGLIASMGELYDASILIFLIGIIVNDWGVY